MKWWALRRRIHSSWLLACAAAACVLGMVLAREVPQVWFTNISWLLTGISLIFTALWWRHAILVVLCIAGGLITGLWRGSVSQAELYPYDYLIGHDIRISGVVTEDADTTQNNLVSLRLGEVVYEGRALPGVIWVSVTPGHDIRRSDRVTIEGELKDGFGSFVASMHRADVERIERPVPGDVALAVRDWFGDSVREVVPEPQASLGLGYLLGQRRALPPELDEALRISGLTHVIVASGYNLTILVRLARRLFARISRYTAVLAASGMIVSFIAVTGMSPSMSRAGLVTGLSLLAWYYGRKFHPLVLLPLAAAVTVLINPSYAWGDVGWQLSFAAFAGVMILAPLGQRYFFGNKEPGTIRQIMGETIAAQIATLPILVVTFGQFSNVALIANLLVLPLVPLAMLLVFVTGILVLWVPWLVGLVAAPTTILLEYMTTVAEFVAGLSWAVTEVQISYWYAIMMYVALVALCVYLSRKTRLHLRDSSVIE